MNTKFLSLSSGKIAYEDSGSGPLVICAPSMGDLRAEYRFLAPQLVQNGYRVVSLDVRGHGETSPDWADYSVGAIGSDILALIRALDAGPAVITGNSMSGGAGIWAAAEAPDLVSSLVLIDPVVGDFGPSWPNRWIYPLLFAQPWGAAVWVRYFQSLFPTRKPADLGPYCDALRANLKEPGRLAALRRMILASKADSAERVTRVKAPSLVLMGSRDPDFKDPEAEARQLGRELQSAGCRVEIIPGAGHYPHVEFPEETGKLVLSFLLPLKEKTRRPNVA
jgi:pimeloyl-ACP methyl ester carboxylesterase